MKRLWGGWLGRHRRRAAGFRIRERVDLPDEGVTLVRVMSLDGEFVTAKANLVSYATSIYQDIKIHTSSGSRYVRIGDYDFQCVRGDA